MSQGAKARLLQLRCPSILKEVTAWSSDLVHTCSGAELAQSLKAHLAAHQAFQQLAEVLQTHGAKDADRSIKAARLVQNLLEATAGDSGKRGVVAAMLSTPKAFESILTLVKVGLSEKSKTCFLSATCKSRLQLEAVGSSAECDGEKHWLYEIMSAERLTYEG